jgi:hypothetical protein
MPEMKAITRREMFKELVSKDTIKQVASAWYGFTQPLSEGLNTTKQESLLDKVKRIDSNYMKNDRKEG